MREFHGEVDLFTALEKIMPHQQRFVTASCRYAALVGGQYNGKSIALCIAHILQAQNDPGGFSLIGRLHQPALANSTMKTFLELIPDGWGEWKPSERRFLWRNGHETVFLHLDITDPKIAGHIKSMNLSAAYIDEASETDEEVFFLVDGRVRRKGAPLHIVRLTSNPGGQDYLWRHFFDPSRPPSWWDSHLGITASTFDNTLGDPAIVAHWVSTYPTDWAQRYLYGSFADFSDRVFKDFGVPTHVWDSSRAWSVFDDSGDPPKSWPVIVGMDIGGGEQGDPWAIAIIAVAPDGRLYQFAEIYGGDIHIAPIAEQLHSYLEGRGMDGLAYDYAQAAMGRELAEHAIYGGPADKAVEAGLKKVAEYLHPDPRLEHPFNPALEASPRYFVSNACTNTIRELVAYKWAKDRSGAPKFKPAHDNSHCPDAVRYALHTFRPFPRPLAAPEPWELMDAPGITESQRVMSQMFWRDLARRKIRTDAGQGEARLERAKERHRVRAARRGERPAVWPVRIY